MRTFHVRRRARPPPVKSGPTRARTRTIRAQASGSESGGCPRDVHHLWQSPEDRPGRSGPQPLPRSSWISACVATGAHTPAWSRPPRAVRDSSVRHLPPRKTGRRTPRSLQCGRGSCRCRGCTRRNVSRCTDHRPESASHRFPGLCLFPAVRLFFESVFTFVLVLRNPFSGFVQLHWLRVASVRENRF